MQSPQITAQGARDGKRNDNKKMRPTHTSGDTTEVHMAIIQYHSLSELADLADDVDTKEPEAEQVLDAGQTEWLE